MKYVYQVRVVKETGVPDSCSYSVVASSGKEAITKALRQAIKDSGYKRNWNVVSLSKGDSYVVV